ncbi:hypothetical protein TWF694_010574 [Orbilia ellipsospora]|uniref:Uncharacterized protein n=1 Tax=Orbilia ellipsospora TaxID=2528407 RepID=A0AAV9XAC2_9PEZI
MSTNRQKRPSDRTPNRPTPARPRVQESPEHPVNRFDDIPAEFKHMLAQNVRETREAAAASRSLAPPSAGEPSTAPKRKKPLTRRIAAEPLQAPEPGPASTSKVSVSETRPVNQPRSTRQPDTTLKETPQSPLQVKTQKAQEQFIQSLEEADLYTTNLAKPGRSSSYSAEQSNSMVQASRNKSVERDAYDDEEEDEEEEFDDDSDVDWETIDLSNLKPAELSYRTNNEPLVLDLSVKLSSKAKDAVRKGPTPVERKIRLEVHKLHVLCLLAHNHYRSRLCNDKKTQKYLLPILEKKVIAELNDNSYQQSKVFRIGLSNAAAAFRRRFTVTKPGTRKPLWGYTASSFDSLVGDGVVGIKEFRAAAQNMEGTRDLGAQLFCALLRRTGLDARMVCSLQPLSYHFKSKYNIDDEKKRLMLFVTENKDDYETSDEDVDSATFVGNVNKAYGGPPPQRPNWRLPPVAAARSGAAPAAKKPSKKREKALRVHDPTQPIYWVEVFDEMSQSWIAVDPLGMGVVRNLTQFEPPKSDFQNEMSYVVAFDNDNHVRDITRKYVKDYNGLTRTLRVDGTLDGAKWWSKALRLYKIPAYMAPDRDQLENGLMEDRVLREGVPKSLSAMKNHPVFVIEEQLRQNEVLHPKVKCGTMSGKNRKSIPVYRRQDVKQVKTATQWYMLGREIKAGEQPLKHKTIKKPKRSREMELDELEEPEEQETGMYAEFQTIIYLSEPCVGPIVPQNAYGNIDLYVPSMLPEGGVHIPHKMARVAADFLGIGDFVADAVVGFDFRTAGKSTPVINGIVVGQESEDALWLMIRHIEKEEAEAADEERRLKLLALWRNMFLKLRIKKHVDTYVLDGDEEEEPAEPSDSKPSFESSKTLEESDAEAASPATITEDGSYRDGGFFTDELNRLAAIMLKSKQEDSRETKWKKYAEKKLAEAEEHTNYAFVMEEPPLKKQKLAAKSDSKGKGRAIDVEGYGGGFMANDDEPVGGGFIVDDGGPIRGGFIVDDDEAIGGGFIADNDETLGGGFIVDDQDGEQHEGGGFLLEEEPGHPFVLKESEGGGFIVEEEAVNTPPSTKKRSRTSTPDLNYHQPGLNKKSKISASPSLVILTDKKRKAQDNGGDEETHRKKAKSVSSSPNVFSPVSSNEVKRKAGDVSNGGRPHKKGKSASPPANDERDVRDEMDENFSDDIQDDEFEYSDAGWTSD